MRTITLLFLLLLANATSAQNFETLKSDAEKGDAMAQLFLSGLYHDGECVPKNDKEAYIWYLVGVETLSNDFSLPKDKLVSQVKAEYTETIQELTGKPPTSAEVARAEQHMQENLGPLLTQFDFTPEGLAKMQSETAKQLGSTKAELQRMLADAQQSKSSPDEIKELQGLLADVENELGKQNEAQQGADDYAEMVAKLTASLSPDEIAEAQAEAKKRAETIKNNIRKSSE